MDIHSDWSIIRQHFNKSFRTNFHVSIASVDNENNPTVTPIGSLFLNDNQSGFYFEKYPSKLPVHAGMNKKICVLAVNSGMLFWLRSLFAGKFKRHPGIKLYGELGILREPTDKETARLNRRMRSTRGLPGNKYLWTNMTRVREVTFIKVEKINLGSMTAHL